jgi:hypothetical protein
LLEKHDLGQKILEHSSPTSSSREWP